MHLSADDNLKFLFFPRKLGLIVTSCKRKVMVSPDCRYTILFYFFYFFFLFSTFTTLWANSADDKLMPEPLNLYFSFLTFKHF